MNDGTNRLVGAHRCPQLALVLVAALVADGCAVRIPHVQRTSFATSAALPPDTDDAWLKAHYRDGRFRQYPSLL